jgi:CheY-like chemotaxis protein
MTPPSSRILVVDDNDALRENLAEALELEGYEVVVAADGDGALDHLAADPPPGVVLLDLMMPGMSGRELLSLIRTNPRLVGVRVVITTGLSGARARVAYADAVLTKPFGVKELLAALRKVGLQSAT